MIKAVAKSLKYLSPLERLVYWILVCVRALTGLLDVAGIALIGLIAAVAAAGIGNKPEISIAGFSLPVIGENELVFLVLIVLGVFLAKSVLAVSLSKVITSFVAKIEAKEATVIAEFLLSGTLDRIYTYSKAEILWAVTGSTSYAFTGLLNSLSTVFSEGVLLFLVGITFFFVDPVATVFVIVYFGLLILAIQFVIGGSLKKAGNDSAEGNIGSNNAINDALDSFREITVLGKKQSFIDSFHNARNQLARSSGTMTFLGGMPRYVVETALMLGVVIFVGWQFLTGQLESGIVTVGVFLTGGVRIMASLLPLQNAFASIKNQVQQSELAQNLLAEAKKDSASPEALPPVYILDKFASPQHPEVKVDSATYSYPGASDNALSNISMSISAGSSVAIIGPSGAGKTTLVDLLLGLIKPTSGDITIGGIHPADYRASAPGSIAYVPQKPGLVSGTIAENIALGVSENLIDYKRINEVIEASNLQDFIAQLPEGVRSTVGKQGDALSGGQAQRLGLARALYTKPRLLILDEATSALDAGSEAEVTASLSNLGKDVTVIVIAHRLSTVQHADEVFVIENGALTASGTFSHLRKTVPLVAEYVELMSFE